MEYVLERGQKNKKHIQVYNSKKQIIKSESKKENLKGSLAQYMRKSWGKFTLD